jgi:transglutaminase-like putative cysteine protease
MLYRVRHTTTYTYTRAVSICHNAVHLRPRDSEAQICTFHELLVDPTPTLVSHATDYFGNPITFLAVQEPHTALTLTAQSIVDLVPPALPLPLATPAWDNVRDSLGHDRSVAGLAAYQYVFDSPYVPTSPSLVEYATPSFPPGRPLLDAVGELTTRIYHDYTYDPTATAVHTPLHVVLLERRGVCQDFTHLQLGCLRALGLAARYVSGYLIMRPSSDGSVALVGAQASHAWVSVYCPGHGWVDVDPTNNMWPAERHITVALGRDYGDVSPIQGVFFGGGAHTLDVAVEVLPVPNIAERRP